MTGGAAEEAGLLVGDVILKVNGLPTKSVPSLQELIGSRNPGDEIAVTVFRKNAVKEISLQLKE